MNRYKEYVGLLSKTYDEAVAFLLHKYGPAKDDYYREKSYYRFMNGEIKNITKGKYSRTSEGLYCHHIDEIKELKISDHLVIKRENIPFEYQKKDRLVYCDLIEHTILHVLIAKETSGKFGSPGYEAYLKPDIENWYLLENMPGIKWENNCYQKSYLEPQETFNILANMQKKLGEVYYDTLEDYYKKIKKREEERRKVIDNIRNRKEKERIERMQRAKTLHNKSPRSSIVRYLYEIKYRDPKKFTQSDNFDEFDLRMKPYIKDDLLEELMLFIDNFEEKNDWN